MSPQENEVGCTLLLIINEELHEVAKANIIQPLERNFHGQPMPPNAYRISIVRVLPGYEEVDPPMQPPGAESEVDLGGSLGYMMLWPKEMIRLDHPGTASNSEPPVRSAPPSNPIIGSTSTSQKTSQKLAEPVGSAPSQGKGTMPPVAPSPIADDPAADDPIEPEAQNNMDPIDAFIADFDGPFEVDIPHGCFPDQQLPEKGNVSKRRLFLSQETPEDVAPDTQTAAEKIITPNTLHGLIDKACSEVVSRPGKPRKRAKKKDKGVSSTQPMPPAAGKPVKEIRSQDNIPIKGWREYHVAGEPILPPEALKTLTGDMRSLHDSVLTWETHLLSMTSPSYPVFYVRVPKRLGFVDRSPGDVFFLRFDDIFEMFHRRRLDPTLVRLVALSMSHQLMQENTPKLAILDPYYMKDIYLQTEGTRQIVTNYITDFMVANKEKKIFLVPYFFE